MKKTFKQILYSATIISLFLIGLGQVLADSYSTNFESFTTGEVHGQDGWTSGHGSSFCPLYDVAVVANTYGFATFGSNSLRISNAITCGSFNDQTFSKSLTDEAGETAADTSTYSGGTRQPYFQAQWDFASTVPGSQQTGLAVVASPDRGDPGRMSWIQMQDTPTGLQVNFQDYSHSLLNFTLTPIATSLDRTIPHNIKITIQFVDGNANDIVKVYVDGSLAYTGTTWEDYFRDFETGPHAVDSILFRVAGTAAPANLGKGFLIDNFSSFSGPVPATTATFHVVKQVINNSGGIATPASFNLHVKLAGTDVVGSPAVGTATPGTSYTLAAGTYAVSEDTNSSYTQSFSGDCDSSGNITLIAGDNKTCTITNDDIPAPATLHVIKQVVNNYGGTATPASFNLHVKLAGTDVVGSPAIGTATPGTSYTLAAGNYVVNEDANSSYNQSFSGDCDTSGNITLIAGDNKICTITNSDIAPASSISITSSGGGGSAAFGKPSSSGGIDTITPITTIPITSTTTPSTPILHPSANPTTPADTSCSRNALTNIPFIDISNHWAKNYIETLYRRCIVDGKTATLFEPDNNISRAELVKIAMNLFKLRTANFEKLFLDVSENDWFSKYVISAAKLMIVEGYISSTTALPLFLPNQIVTRAEALKIFLQAKGVTNLNSYDNKFSDVAKDNWFYPFVAYAQNLNLIQGFTVEYNKSGRVGNFYTFPRLLGLSDLGKDVRNLKVIMAQLGYYDGEINTIYDSKLENAMSAYQSTKRVKVTGQMGSVIRTLLLKETLKPITYNYFRPNNAVTRAEVAELALQIAAIENPLP